MRRGVERRAERLRSTVGDGRADFPVVRRRDTQLRQRQRCPGAVSLPELWWRRRKRRQRHEIVPHVEGVVRLDETDRRAHGDTDAAALDDHVVLEPANQPYARRFMDDDEPQAMLDGRGRPVDLDRRGCEIVGI